MYKHIGQMDKGGHYDVEIKGWMEKGALRGNKKVDANGGIMMCIQNVDGKGRAL